jgi:hypothetical protein
MYCGECGTKNVKNAHFCEKCGAPLVTEKEVSKKSSKRQEEKKSFGQTLKEIPKKNKMIACVIAIVVIAFLLFYTLVGSKFTPKAIAKDYFLAIINQDANKLYDYLDIEKSEFTTKDMFVKVMAEENSVKVANYTVDSVQKDSSGLSVTVTITYFLENSKDSKTMNIVLVKQKNKKYGIFNNWKVSADEDVTVDDYKIKVLKDSKVTIEDVLVDTKYIDSDASDGTYDVYVIPAMFKQKYHAVITLPYGFDVEDDMNVTSYASYTYSFSKDSLPEKVQETIKNTVKTGLQTLYDGAKDKKSFDDIKSSFEYNNVDLETLKETYENLVSGLEDKGLTSITYKDIDIVSFKTYSEQTFYAYIKATYDYELSYESNGEEKTHSSENKYTYLYVYFTYEDGAFRISNVGSLNTYFSKYY